MSTSRVEVVRRADDSGRFRVLEVDRDYPIKAFVEDNGLTFQTGLGFHEATKPESVGAHKEIISLNVETGEFVAGAPARERLGLPIGAEGRTPKTDPAKVRVFVQSTSSNRKLAKGTWFPLPGGRLATAPFRDRPKPKGDHDPLFQAVLDDPSDDVRLVYADWCEENDQAKRAEFIRLQVKLAQLERQARYSPSGEPPAGVEKLKTRAEAVLDARSPARRTWREEWLADLPDVVHPWVTWDRGFVHLEHRAASNLAPSSLSCRMAGHCR